MSITIYKELMQGTDEWLEARRGILTASEMKHIITPSKLGVADNDKARAHLYELLAQRISGFVEAKYISDDMLRGEDDEIRARDLYSEKYAEVDEVGFITNDKWGVKIGYSPDGLVGDDGLIEVKSRLQKFQIQTILSGSMPEEYMLQVQTGLLVSERAWCDFISYCGGLPMVVIRVYPDERVQNAIVDVARGFETQLLENLAAYNERLLDKDNRLTPTERIIEEEIII